MPYEKPIHLKLLRSLSWRNPARGGTLFSNTDRWLFALLPLEPFSHLISKFLFKPWPTPL
jgi:hypothetical protein